MSIHDHNKAAILPLRDALRAGDAPALRQAIMDSFAPDAQIKLGAPFYGVAGPADLWDRVYAPLFAALSDMERVEFIVMAGPRSHSDGSGDWIGLGGHIVGTLNAHWLGIPATGAPVFMRYHEYLRMEDGKIVEMQGLWDIGQVMQQAGVWPMGSQAGVAWMCPGPADGQGVLTAPRDAGLSETSLQRVWDMLHDLQHGTAKTPERGLGGFWHDNAVWYGPAGLGMARGHNAIAQKIFRQFREGLSENTRHLKDGVFFADQNLVAFTGWPSGTAVHSGDGFLGLAATGKTVTRCSLDFWRIEEGLVRECWVMVDMIDLFKQLGVDVFERMIALPGYKEAA